MKTMLQKTVLLCALAALLLCHPATTRAADAGGTVTVAEGGSQRYDRVGQW